VKKYNYRDNFEYLYLRHDYAKRCKNLNSEYLKEFNGIINKTVNIMFAKHYPIFTKMGFEKEDIITVASMYVLYYMELYSIRNNTNYKNKYIQNYTKSKNKLPSEDDVYQYDKISMINFLRQKLAHMSKVCSRKSKNIIGGHKKRYIFALTENAQKVDDNLIIDNHNKYGYRVVTIKEFKEAKKRAKLNNSSIVVDDNGFEILEIDRKNKFEIIDYPLDNDRQNKFEINQSNMYNSNPEDLIIDKQKQLLTNRYRDLLNSMSEKRQKKLLKKFVKNNKHIPYMKKELTLARKMIAKGINHD